MPATATLQTEMPVTPAPIVTPSQSTKLILPDLTKIRASVEPTVDEAAKLQAEANKNAVEIVNGLLSGDITDPRARANKSNMIDGYGQAEQRSTAVKSKLLNKSVSALSKMSADGSPLANGLLQLKAEVEALDPQKWDFEPGWFGRMMSRLPWVGLPINKYISKFESAQSVIDSIERSLIEGGAQRGRDNAIMIEDQAAMRELSLRLQGWVMTLMAVDVELEKRANAMPQDSEERRLLLEEMLFPLRQKISDLQQSVLINQQGVMTFETIVRINKELIRGVERSRNTMIPALHIASSASMAFAGSEQTAEVIEATKKTGEQMLARNAEMLRTKGVDMYKRAAGSMLDTKVMAKATADIIAALDEISRYRQEALPMMAHSIMEMDELTKVGEEAIKRMEKGNKAAAGLSV